MDCNSIKSDLRVKTIKLGKTKGILVKEKYLNVRESGVGGTVMNHVPGHGGHVWFVKHDGCEDIGVYCFYELEPA